MSITFSQVSSAAAASAVFVEQEAVSRSTGSPLIEHKILVLGQYNSGFTPTANAAQLVLDKEAAWSRYGRGSMLSMMIEKLLAYGGGIKVYAMPLADGAGDAAVGTLAYSAATTAAGTINNYIGGKKVSTSVASGTSAADVATAVAASINADLDLPVTAAAGTGTVTLTCRHKGEIGNQILLEVNRASTDETPAGLAVVVTTMASGSTDPVLTTALESLGDDWYTEICNPYISAASLTAMEAAGVARGDASVSRPFVGIEGYTGTVADFITELDTRNSEWTSFVPVFGSPTPAFMIAAAATAIYANAQQTNPGRPVKTLTLPGVIAGSTNNIIATTRDTLVKAGGSHTYNQSDDTVTIGDMCTTRTTEASGAATTDYRFTIILSNMQFKIYAVENKFLASPFDRGVVLDDGGGEAPTYGIRPSTVKTVAVGLVDDWVAKGLSTARDAIVAGITAEINDDNAGRIDLLIPDVPSAGLRILATKIEWGFLVG